MIGYSQDTLKISNDFASNYKSSLFIKKKTRARMATMYVYQKEELQRDQQERLLSCTSSKYMQESEVISRITSLRIPPSVETNMLYSYLLT